MTVLLDNVISNLTYKFSSPLNCLMRILFFFSLSSKEKHWRTSCFFFSFLFLMHAKTTLLPRNNLRLYDFLQRSYRTKYVVLWPKPWLRSIPRFQQTGQYQWHRAACMYGHREGSTAAPSLTPSSVLATWSGPPCLLDTSMGQFADAN